MIQALLAQQFDDLETVKPASPRGVEMPAPTSGLAREDQLCSVLRGLARKLRFRVENGSNQAVMRLFGSIVDLGVLQRALDAMDDREPAPGGGADTIGERKCPSGTPPMSSILPGDSTRRCQKFFAPYRGIDCELQTAVIKEESQEETKEDRKRAERAEEQAWLDLLPNFDEISESAEEQPMEV